MRPRPFFLVLLLTGPLAAEEHTERFDKDPGWDGQNNRATSPEKRTIRQDFGFSRTAHAGGAAGEVGGFITPAAETAYYARKIEPKSFADPLSASGKLVCKSRANHLLIGFFNADTVSEWRTPNSIAIRLLGRGNVFYAFVEYATSKWRAGGDSPGGFATVKDAKTGRLAPRGFRTGERFDWSLKYDPAGNRGAGARSSSPSTASRCRWTSAMGTAKRGPGSTASAWSRPGSTGTPNGCTSTT